MGPGFTFSCLPLFTRTVSPEGGGAPENFALVSQVSQALGVNGGTTSGIDTTGSAFIALALSYYDATSGAIAAGSITDSKGNTYTAATNYTSSNHAVRIFYCLSPIVGAGHTFTASVTATYSVLSALAFSVSPAPSFEAVSGAAGAIPGSLTPSVDNSLVISAGVGLGSAGALTADGDFTTHSTAGVDGVNVAGGIAYLIQTTAAAANPTWSETSTSTSAVFIPAP